MSFENHAHTPKEIDGIVRRGYVDRLKFRSEKMRLLLSARKWDALYHEVKTLHQSARSFGFNDIYSITDETLFHWPINPISKGDAPKALTSRIEKILGLIDQLTFDYLSSHTYN